MTDEVDDFALWSFASTGKAGEYKVYNAGNEGYKAMYKDDGYLWLELYHHDGGDSESFLRGAYASYKIDERSLGVTMTDYKGLKIISKGIDSNEPHIFTLDFAQ